MARKRPSDEDKLDLLREIELKLANGSDVQSACVVLSGRAKTAKRQGISILEMM